MALPGDISSDHRQVGIHVAYVHLVVGVLPRGGFPGHRRVDRSGSALVPRATYQGMYVYMYVCMHSISMLIYVTSKNDVPSNLPIIHACRSLQGIM